MSEDYKVFCTTGVDKCKNYFSFSEKKDDQYRHGIYCHSTAVDYRKLEHILNVINPNR
ncbi:hypothetical protein CCY01nite_19720 [Chitinophaga cymbidii]|uniref:Uncharacterized protein n=1 Tax=Chitinophaga cymbidii TaxID=1096750 RepID=A0A512RJ69_9BACT|nr:hypothetical protein CCY01nite_19720 [Chitinophaga cymbidii]